MPSERYKELTSRLTVNSHQRNNLEIITTSQCAVTDNNENSIRNNKDDERK